GEARGGRPAPGPFGGPEPPEVLTNMRSRARRSAGVESSRRPRGFSSVSSASPLVFESFDPGPSLFLAIWSIARTNSHSVVAFQRPHPDSAFAGGRLGRASPLFVSAFLAKQSIGSPTRIDRG